MASRLPAVRSLAEQLRTKRIHGTRVSDAAGFLASHQGELELFEDVEHLAFSTDPEYATADTTPELQSVARALAHHLGVIRSSLAEALWSREIFVDAEVLDDVVFWAARNPRNNDAVIGALETIRDARINRPGLLIFPLHSLGFARFGAVPPAHRKLAIINPEAGYALAPQTNSMDGTIDFLDEVAKAFGARKVVSRDLIVHWRKTRPTSWLEHNPLLALRTIQFPGSYYGNQAFLLARVKATTALICMLSALQKAASHEGELFSTRLFNNWQTLDIHHYIALFDAPSRRGELEGHCVPIQEGRREIAELSALDLDLDPRHARQSMPGVRAHAAIERLFTYYLQDRVLRRRETARTRTVTKFFNALVFYRRSFQRGTGDWRAKVALSTAFEMLLTDSYRGGVTVTLERRTRVVLKGTPGVKAMASAVSEMYVARSAAVHAGTDKDADLALARRAFAHCFIELIERLPQLSARSATPMADLTDHYSSPRQ